MTYCAANNDLEMMIFLIKNKADVKIRDTTDCTPFSYACKVSNIKMMKYLLKYTDLKSEYDADPKLIFSLISENIPEPLNFLVNAGFEINNVNHLGYTPLMSAIFRNNVKIAITLLNNNADVNIKANNGKTALMYAIELQNKWLVKLLIQKGADLKAVDEEGLDAKAYARRTENHDFIRFFDYYVKISTHY